MKWVGKIAGGALGLLALGPVGGLVGLLLGHQFDVGLGAARPREQRRRTRGSSNAARQQVFFETTFMVMGHLAKADGRVSEEEIQTARTIMHQMRLRPEHVRLAIDLFSRGKRPDFVIDEQMAQFRAICGGHRDLIRAFLETQVEMALSKGRIAPREREVLWRVSDALGVGRVELAQLEAILRAQRSFRSSRTVHHEVDRLGQAYKALGVTPDASDRDVKTAYRRLMNEHHPDKLVSRGLPDSMLEAAKERTHEIRSAYETIKEQRKMK